MSKVLVTGHLGFVGRHLCKTLIEQGYEVVGLDTRNGNDILNCDLPEADLVFHLAAQTDAQSEDVEDDALTNVIGSIKVFERYRDKVVFASSSMVNYPVSPYAISKRAAEDYARYFGCAIVRFCNLYGAGGHSAIDKFRESERLKIYGSGDQLRTYAPVSDAVDALLAAVPGTTIVLKGENYTVNEVAERFAYKEVDRLPARKLDPMDGRQVV